MKEKIFESLKREYSNLGLGDDILQGHAESLAATGFVTDENLNAVISSQKTFLSSLQSGMDKRVTDAINKAKEKKEDPANGGEQKKNATDIQKLIDNAIEAKVSTLQKELDAYKIKEQQSTRAALIYNKAKELGIPDWRQKEGFAITDEMDEAAINSYLSGIKQNIVTNQLEAKNSAFPLSTPEAQGKELAKQWAASLPDAN